MNLIAAIITVFDEKRDIASIWAWLLVLLLFPVVGFFIYAFLGRKISHSKIFDLRTQEDLGIDQIAENQRDLLAKNAEEDRENTVNKNPFSIYS
ncbi:Cardiolipin synthase [Weissella viridescens]|uniref:Cardiolipin synthase n=1 Tax=Weissella viridescens TaxID=1629 RepID=A0A380P3M7_WEIVI|nr:Cardiolipin synthase [Weissella viridescens]